MQLRHEREAVRNNRNNPMNTQSNAIRELSNEECENISGGVGFLVAFAVLAGAAAAGSLLAVCTAPKEEVLVPDIKFPD
jgi:lactobin A/cerein 7B family class IIb bacteriocin